MNYSDYVKMSLHKALHSIGLVGIRNITKLIVGGVSPFNIADQVKLPPFSLRNVHDLYAQYTAETNQPLIYRGHKYVIETKLNRAKLQTTVEKAIQQIAGKYLTTERADEGYIIIFDLKTTVGDPLEQQRHLIQGKEIVSFVIGIRKSSEYRG